MIPVILAWLVVLVALPLNWYVTFRLDRLSRANPDVRVLRERSYVAVSLALVVTIFAVVFLNNGMEFPILDLVTTQLLTRGAILGLALPALLWLWIYRNGRRG